MHTIEKTQPTPLACILRDYAVPNTTYTLVLVIIYAGFGRLARPAGPGLGPMELCWYICEMVLTIIYVFACCFDVRII